MSSKTDVEAVLIKWYKKHAQPVFLQMAHDYGNQVGILPHTVKVGNARTRWGSCQRERRLIMLNWKLALMPIEIANYVVAHEVAHLQIANHSEKFWQVVDQLYPEAKRAKQWLRQHGNNVSLITQTPPYIS